MFKKNKKNKKKKVKKVDAPVQLKIGRPKDFKHTAHMKEDKSAPFGVDNIPDEWVDMLEKSQITKERVNNNKEKVMQALSAVNSMKKMRKTIEIPNDAELEETLKKLQIIQLQSPNERFTKLVKVGAGAAGTVYKVRDKQTRKIVAAKVCNIADKEYIKAEIAYQGLLNHRNLVSLIGTWQYRKEITIVMEYCDCNLTRILGTEPYDLWSEPHIAYVAHECLQGLKHMHDAYILHRDIKSDNVLVTFKGEVKLADFGFSIGLSKQKNKRKSTVGTAIWMAPEVMQGNLYDERCDIWSLGITMLELSEQEPPHMEKEQVEAILDIITQPPPKPKEFEMWSFGYTHMIEQMLTKKDLSRPTASQLILSSKDFLNKRTSQEHFAGFVKYMDKLKTTREARKKQFVDFSKLKPAHGK